MRRFVIHENHTLKVIFELSLEADHELLAWAIPKGISMNPTDRRLAVQIPPRPRSYLNFEGPRKVGLHGRGQVLVWDSGHYEVPGPVSIAKDSGLMIVSLYGSKVKGEFMLRKVKRENANWLIIKSDDEFAQDSWRVHPVAAHSPGYASSRDRR